MTSDMKANTTQMPSGKAAFTLVELLVVVGLMALLGTVSVTGYFAAARGMSDRAALQDSISIVRLAMQTCLIDQTPTAVLFYNRQMNVGDKVTSDEARASGAGAAIAIKMVGRISYVKNNVIVDEFADWNQSYPVSVSGNDNDPGIPFYRMPDLSSQVAGGINKCRSFVSTAVEPVSFDNEYMIAYGGQVQNFCDHYKKYGSDNKKFSGTTYSNGNNQRWGHRIRDRNGINWKAGDAYGMEIARLDLPQGYIYGSSAPNSTKVDPAGALVFNPSDVANIDTYEMRLTQTIYISANRGDNTVKIASITANDLKDDAK